ncbi:MAG: hypothetical protein AB1389_04030 [Campylobacterota bacterium]
MKNLIFLTCLIFIFGGCQDKESNDTTNNAKSENTATDNANQSNSPKITVTEGVTNIEKDNPFVTYDLDGNRVVKLAPDGEETALTKEIGALATIRNNYERLNAKILSKRLSKNYILKCSACHDDYANGVIGPSLLDKNAKEISDMIKAYRSKTKANVLMKDLVSKMEDAEIESLADEISKLNKEVTEAKNER